MRVTLIHNPDAGDGDQPSGDEILSLMRSAGHSAVYQSSKEPGWEKALEDQDLAALFDHKSMPTKDMFVLAQSLIRKAKAR